MNPFLAIYLGISIVTIFTNSPIKVFAVELEPENQSSYVGYANYNQAQKYYQEVSNPLDILKQKIENERQIIENINKQKAAQEAKIAQQTKKKVKPKLSTEARFATSSALPSGTVENLIYYWTSVYGGDPAYHLKIARCESGLNPNSIGGGGLYLGVYQQAAKYWPARAARYGFAGSSPFDANANVAVSIAMMRTMGYGHWGCA